MGERRVIRLVTQFDSPRARAVAATPTCCCCCCCCCCVATIIGTSAYTAASTQAIARTVSGADPGRVRWPSPWAAVVGALALPLAVAVALGTWWTVIVPFAVWYLLVALAYRGAGDWHPWTRAIGVVVLGTGAVAAEFFVVLSLLSTETEGSVGLYLAVAVLLGAAIAVACVLHFRDT